MITKTVLLNTGEEVTLYLDERNNKWCTNIVEVFSGTDNLDSLLMAEDTITISNVTFSRKEISVLKRYTKSLSTLYSKQKLRYLANHDGTRLKQLINTIIEHKV